MKREVPTNIRTKMHTATKLFARAWDIMSGIDVFFEKSHPTIDIDRIFRANNGCSLTEIENGNDITDEFVKWYESIDWDKEASE